MHRVLRVVIALILVAAVPLQGVAAATMAVCGPGHSTVPKADSMAHAHDHASSRASKSHAMHHHEPARLGVGAHFAAGAAHTSPDKAPKSKCSVCASCCANAAMPSAALIFEAIAATEFFAPPLSIGLPVFLTAGLERPPRSLLA